MSRRYYLERVPVGKAVLYQIVRRAEKVGLPMTLANAQKEIERLKAKRPRSKPRSE